MKKIIQIFPIVAIITILSFALPSQTYAVWWNPLSWFSKDKQVEKQKPQTEEVKNNNSTTTSAEIKEEQNKASAITTPQNNPSDVKTIKDLKTEIATLKASLGSLYKAHNNLVNDHNALLEYTKSIATANKGSSAQPVDTSNFEWRITNLKNQIEGGGRIIGLNSRVTELERKTGLLVEDSFNASNELAKQTMLFGLRITPLERMANTIEIICRRTFGGVVCPLVSTSLSIEDRIKKLEGGY